jgi:prepilin-type N-terminal cleavage/methylation domain-containing protein
MTLTTGRRNSGAGGFTLLELVLVMMIMALIMAVAAPSLAGFLRGRRSANAAGQILALGQYARTQSVSSGVVYRLAVDTTTQTYQLLVQRGAEFILLGNEFGRIHEMPVGVTAQWQSTGGEIPGYAEFYPDGRVACGILDLTDPDGRVVELGCRSETETMRIINEDTR